MKLKGISDQGFQRIAKKAQFEPGLKRRSEFFQEAVKRVMDLVDEAREAMGFMEEQDIMELEDSMAEDLDEMGELGKEITARYW